MELPDPTHKRAPLALLLLALTGGCGRVNDVRIDFARLPDAAGPQGFGCLTPPVMSPVANGCLVVDVIPVPGALPSCQPTSLRTHCSPDGVSSVCAPSQRWEQTVTLVPPADPMSPSARMRAISDALARVDGGTEILGNLPHGNAIVRVVLRRDSCPATPLAPAASLSAGMAGDILGCAYSCPVNLDATQSVTVDAPLAPGSSECTASELCRCANAFGGDTTVCADAGSH